MIQKSSFWLKLRMYFLVIILFALLYGLAVLIVNYAAGGLAGPLTYGILAIVILGIQYLVGPKIVEWSMRVKYVSAKEEPELHEMVEELAKKAGLPKPKVGIARVPFPNAFAFGRWKSDGRVCVTEGILKLLDKKELKAVLGHEIGHLKNRDVVIITLLSIIPLICWHLAWSLMFSRDNENRGSMAMIGIFAFILYFITNLLVLYASRIREYYADYFSVRLGNQPHSLASALYKLVYGSARTPREALKQVEGIKAFFANDPSRALAELKELSQLDLDGSGHLDEKELETLRSKPIKIRGLDKFMEIMSTHPNMVKRIKALSALGE